MSRQDKPKQLLPLVEDDSMYKVTVKRLSPLFPPQNIYVVTGRKYFDILRADTPDIPAQNFIIEPYGRNTAPAVALGLSIIQKRDPEATVAIMHADHSIARSDEYRKVLHSAHDLAQEGHIVTLGIEPSFPAVEFGYIHRGAPLTSINGHQCYHALGFTEKPDEETAAQFVKSGEYSWNAGIFIWRVDRAMAEFRRQQPEMYEQFNDISRLIDTSDFEEALESIWDNIRNIPIDIAVMENAENLAVIPVDIGWNDIGSWGALFDVLRLDKFGNYFKGRSNVRVVLDTENTLVYSDKLTVTIGIEDLIVVETDDALLICHKDRTQDVKEVVNRLLTNKNYKYL
jgi:mannose-1-phosphate guanylyltransferase